MGYVTVTGLIGDPRKVRTREIEFLVDTGAFHTALTHELAKELGLRASAEIEITVVDKRQVKAGISLAYIKILDRESVLPIVILAVPKPLLGITILEGLGIRVDPATGNVDYSRPFGVALLSSGS